MNHDLFLFFVLSSDSGGSENCFRTYFTASEIKLIYISLFVVSYCCCDPHLMRVYLGSVISAHCCSFGSINLHSHRLLSGPKPCFSNFLSLAYMNNSAAQLFITNSKERRVYLSVYTSVHVHVQ